MAEPQPPEGLRKLFIEVAHGQNCIGCVIGRGRCGGLDEVDEDVADAFLAALFEACEVREQWGVRLIITGDGEGEGWVSDGWLESRGHADSRMAYHQHKLATVPGWRATPVLIRRCVLNTPPDPPVSSTGEEKTDG